MRNFVPAALCVRYKKPLLISVLAFVVIAVLYSWVILDSSFLTYSGSKLPKLSEWLGSGQAGMAGEKSDGKLSADASFSARQKLGSDIQRLFVDYEPSADAVNQTFLEKWPTMVGFQLDKKFNYDEVANASTNFFVDDEASESFKKQQQELMDAIPSWASVSNAFSGRGVVICAGSYDLSRIWPNVALMMRSLGSSLPIEVWTKDEEEYSRTLPMADQLRTELGMTISVHTLSDYMSIVWAFVSVTEIYKVKALSLLLSSFEEAILFDSDSVPVMDPEVLFDSEEGKSGLIQWPDFWTNSLSKVMHDAYDVDYSFTRTCESGQVMINKKKQFEPLVMTSYFNWWGPTFFYKLINLDGMGAGDKDTFWVGSAVYHRDYHVVGRALELITAKKHNGSLWKETGGVFNGAMGQFNPINTSEIFTMHLHAPKINLQAPELYGQYDLQFFLPEEKQNVSYAKGALWLETHLWENLQWVECESVHRNLTSNACEGVKERVISLREALGE